MIETTFGFQSTTLSLAVSALAILAVCWLSLQTCLRTRFRQSIVLLEVLRVALVCLAVFILNQPESVEQFRPTEKPTVAILVDRSRSMDTRDATSSDSRDQDLVPRAEGLAQLADPQNWSDLSETMDVLVTPIGAEDAGARSDLHSAIQTARDQHPNLRAIVLASDGDWNSGPPPVEAAMALRLEQVPIMAIPVGRATRLPDLELLSFDVPTFGVAGKNVRLPFTIESSLPRDHVVQLQLDVSDGSVLRKQVRLTAMGRTSDAIVWNPESTGDYTLTLSIPDQPEESVLENNSIETPIAIREEKLKVLVIESLPRWEYRYLRNALSRDPGVEVNCLLFHPGLSKVGGGNVDYLPSFPEELEELSQFDVVFLGDVGLEDGQLTEEQCRLLKGLVEQQASGLVFMPGLKGHMLSLESSPLDALLPVTMDKSQPQGWGSRTPSHFALTESGRRSLLTKLADTQDENIQVWENLPGFQWHAPIIRARAGTEVLAVHQELSNNYGRIPLLVTRTFGAGKILFMGTDGAWRWRRGVEDLYHYRFWGQVVRWMAYQRNMAEGELMRFYFAPEQPRVGQTVALSANVMAETGEPLSSGNVTARIVAPSGRSETVQLSSADGEWGAFTGTFNTSEPGPHQMTLRCRENDGVIESTLFVQGETAEQVGKPARPEVLEELARVTGGMVLEPTGVKEIVDAVAAVPEPPPKIRRIQIWSHPLLAGLFVALLGVFWVGRKIVGLI